MPGSVFWLIAVTTAIRLWFAWAIGLGIDESYMVAAGRTLRWGYFDHPPLAWWLSAGITHLAGTEAALVVRLPFIALFALSTALMYRLTALLFSREAALWAAAAFNVAPVLGVTTGTWVLPDGPLIASLLAAALCLVHALAPPNPRHSRAWAWWLAAGAGAGLALLSKYSAALVLIGAFAYLLTQPKHRPWLTRPEPYLAGLIAVLLFTPVIIWNAHHQWASFAFQGERATVSRLNPLGPLENLGGIALYLLPWIWLPLVLQFVRGLRAGPADWQRWLLCCLAAGPVLFFPLVSLWSRTGQFHWAAPGYLFLFPLLGDWLARWRPRPARLWIGGSAALVCAGLLAVALEVHWNWVGRIRPGADPGLQGIDWIPLRAALQARGLQGDAVAATNWRDGGKIAYALGGNPPVICLNADAREFGFMPPPPPGADVLVIAPAGHAGFDPTLFASVQPLPPLSVQLSGRTVQFALSIGHHLQRWPP